jgi:phospholipase/carboxylesterase
MSESLVIQSPPSPSHLMLLFHGVGGSPKEMLPLGQRIAAAFPQAAIISVAAPDISDNRAGFQWFSIRGISESNRVQRIAGTMARFIETIRLFQQGSGVPGGRTALIGFSQGGFMALAASLETQPPADVMVSLAGRFAQLPERAPGSKVLHLIHGAADPVISSAHSSAAAERLTSLGANVTLDLIPSLGHGIDKSAADKVVERLMGDFNS